MNRKHWGGFRSQGSQARLTNAANSTPSPSQFVHLFDAYSAKCAQVAKAELIFHHPATTPSHVVAIACQCPSLQPAPA
jgi:hypothetical protein